MIKKIMKIEKIIKLQIENCRLNGSSIQYSLFNILYSKSLHLLQNSLFNIHHSTFITLHSKLITHHSKLITLHSKLITHHSKLITLSLIFALCSFLSSFSQNIDSLKQELKTAKHDTTKIIILTELSELCEVEDILKYAQPSINLCEKNLQTNKLSKQQTAFYKEHLADALNNIGYLAQQQSDLPKALEYYHKSLKIQEEIMDKNGIASSLNNIGVIYNNQGDIHKALEYYHKSLKIKEEIKDKDGIASSLNNIGYIYMNQGDILKALEYYHKCLKIKEEINDKNGIASSLNNIGLIYKIQGDIPKALECYNKSLKIREEIKDKNGIATSLINIGVVFDNQGSAKALGTFERDSLLAKSLEYYQKSLKIEEEINDKNGIAITSIGNGKYYCPMHCEGDKVYDKAGDCPVCGMDLINIGGIYKDLGDISKALEYYCKSLKIREEIKDKKGIAGSTYSIANVMLQKGWEGKALDFANRSMQLAKELGFPDQIKRAALTLKNIYKKQNKFKDALEMYELEILMRDSITNAETKKASIRKQFQYQYEKKAAADSVKNEGIQ